MKPRKCHRQSPSINSSPVFFFHHSDVSQWPNQTLTTPFPWRLRLPHFLSSTNQTFPKDPSPSSFTNVNASALRNVFRNQRNTNATKSHAKESQPTFQSVYPILSLVADKNYFDGCTVRISEHNTVRRQVRYM